MKSPTPRRAIRPWLVVSRRPLRAGLTIVELLVAAAIALLMVAGLVTAFQVIGDQVAIARATLEVSGQLRMGQHTLRENLTHASAPARPWLRPADGHGYFEYFEGPMYDTRLPGVDDSIMGDIDDILMFTARNEREPFRGRYRGASGNDPPTIVTSSEAEIIIWARWNDDNGNSKPDPEEQVTIHRRILLVRPDLALPTTPLKDFYAANDISAHVGTNRLVANSLSDLTKREHRFAHGNAFPFPIDRALLENLAQSRPKDPAATPPRPNDEPNLGNDVILSNVLAFDVKAYDPLVEVRADPNENALLPDDNAYSAAAGKLLGRGGYVDLNYRSYATAVANASHFADPPHTRSKLGAAATYCTWPFHYETDGVNQDGIGPADQGTDGFDNDNQNGVDDIGERETSPPYPHPLRGIKVTIRLYEPDSRSVRQASIINDFIPE